MEIQIPASVEAKIRERAMHEGREPSMIAVEALEDYVNYDAWYLARVDEAIADFETGNDFSHDDVAAEIEGLLGRHRAKAS